MASLSRDEVAHVARLARLELTDEQIDVFTPQLAAILEHAADVEALDLDRRRADVAPVPADERLAPRRGSGRRCPRRRARTGPAAEDGMFRVPPVLGEAP